MKILLDIDGVMIPAKPWQTYEQDSDGFGMFSKHAIDGLNKIIISSFQPEIILTTSHKHKFTLSEWKQIFSNRGIINIPIERLDSDTLKTSRFDEIKSWYLRNQNEPFIVIDDDKSLNAFDLNFKDDHLVLTKPEVGLNKLSVDDAIKKIIDLEETIY